MSSESENYSKWERSMKDPSFRGKGRKEGKEAVRESKVTTKKRSYLQYLL